MLSYIKRVLLFAIVPLLSIISIDVWLRGQNTIYKEKYNGLMHFKDTVQILILGNSHANYGVDPTQFEDKFAYNLASVSQSIYFDKRLTIKALNEGINNLKFIFISVDYASFYESSQGIRNLWSYYGNGIKYKDEKYLLADISPFLFGYTPKVSVSILKKKIGQKIKYRDIPIIDFDIEEGVNLKDTIKGGFLTFTGTNEKAFTELEYLRRAKYLLKQENNNIRNKIIEDLSEFIIYLKNKDITPILFTTPTYFEFNQHLDSARLNQNRLDIQKICEMYDLKYWNFMNDNRFEMCDFFNCDHLNKQGAKKFGKILSDRLSSEF